MAATTIRFSRGLESLLVRRRPLDLYVEKANTSIKRIAVAGGDAQPVRPELARNLIGVYESTVYYVVDRALVDGRQQFEVHAAPIGNGPARPIVTVPISRVASWQVVNPSLSPDGRWLAMPFTDGFTTNIWAISTEDGRLRQVTDFGDRAVFIAARVVVGRRPIHLTARRRAMPISCCSTVCPGRQGLEAPAASHGRFTRTPAL
jgi:hypothetical protein